jgi:hypothetical protein
MKSNEEETNDECKFTLNIDEKVLALGDRALSSKSGSDQFDSRTNIN